MSAVSPLRGISETRTMGCMSTSRLQFTKSKENIAGLHRREVLHDCPRTGDTHTKPLQHSSTARKQTPSLGKMQHFSSDSDALKEQGTSIEARKFSSRSQERPSIASMTSHQIKDILQSTHKVSRSARRRQPTIYEPSSLRGPPHSNS